MKAADIVKLRIRERGAHSKFNELKLDAVQVAICEVIDAHFANANANIAKLKAQVESAIGRPLGVTLESDKDSRFNAK